MLEEIDGLYYWPLENNCDFCLMPAKWKVYNSSDTEDETALTCDEHKMVAFRARSDWQQSHADALSNWEGR